MEELYYLSDKEKEKLEILAEDPIAIQAVQKVILEELYFMGRIEKGEELSNKNWAYTLSGESDIKIKNEELGAILKATAKGLAALERGVEKIKSFKRVKVEEDKEDINPAE